MNNLIAARRSPKAATPPYASRRGRRAPGGRQAQAAERHGGCNAAPSTPCADEPACASARRADCRQVGPTKSALPGAPLPTPPPLCLLGGAAVSWVAAHRIGVFKPAQPHGDEDAPPTNPKVELIGRWDPSMGTPRAPSRADQRRQHGISYHGRTRRGRCDQRLGLGGLLFLRPRRRPGAQTKSRAHGAPSRRRLVSGSAERAGVGVARPHLVGPWDVYEESGEISAKL